MTEIEYQLLYPISGGKTRIGGITYTRNESLSFESFDEAVEARDAMRFREPFLAWDRSLVLKVESTVCEWDHQ